MAEARTFVQMLANLPPNEELKDDKLLEGVEVLKDELDREIGGQEATIWRIIQMAALNCHALLESVPGQGKTTLFENFAQAIGYRYRRIQCTPDMVPTDLIGSRLIYLTKERPARASQDPTTSQNPKTSQEPTRPADVYPRLKWRRGPLFANLVIADEINRTPPKTQAAALQPMQERQISRIDREQYMPIYHLAELHELEKLHVAQAMCYLQPVPSPFDRHRSPYLFVATENPIEMEGTYPLPEAQLDRFALKLIIHPVDIQYYDKVVRVNLLVQRRDKQPVKLTGIPLWLRSALFFESLRKHIVDAENSYLNRLRNEKPGLYERVFLAILLTHAGRQHTAFLGDEAPPPPDEMSKRLTRLLTDWEQAIPHGKEGEASQLRDAVVRLLPRPIFDQIEAGSSPRGLLYWLQFAAAEAFFKRSATIRREHFRSTAADVLRHRVRLTAQARAEQRRSEDIIDGLINAVLPKLEAGNEDQIDAASVLPMRKDMYAIH